MTLLSTRTGLVGLSLLAVAGGAVAQVSTEQGASILIYPKVVADSSADTVVQLVNLSPSRVFAVCYYIDGTTWQAASFGVALEPQQPISWVAARGRSAEGENGNDIPAAPADFRGELLCVQTDQSGAALSGNQFAGHATIADLASGDVAAYAAVGLNGLGLNDGDDQLCIGGEPSDACLFGAEYDPCPAEWIVNHAAEGAPDGELGNPARLRTRLSVVPCSLNVRDAEPAFVGLQFLVTNEFEQPFSGTVRVTCWADLSLADIDGDLFDRGNLGSDVVQTRIRPAASSGRRTSLASAGNAFVLVAELERAAGDGGAVVSRSAITPHRQGQAAGTDLIVLPAERP